jgi:[ribosomal protein S5]-alanine N-acetyltransferase
MAAIPQLTEPLSDDRVVLRDAAERDIPEILIAFQDDPQLHLRLGVDRPPSGAELGSRAERAPAGRAAGTQVTLTILQPGSDDCRGQLYAQDIDWDHSRAELGIWLAPQVRRKGLAVHALRLAAGWLFDVCRLERLQVLTHPDNDAMIRAARDAGFVYEGVLRGYERERGQRVDLAILSLLPGDLAQ